MVDEKCLIPFAGSITGTSPTNSLSGLASLQSLGNNNFASSISPGLSNSVNGLGSSAPSGMDALSQAYTGIQQYQGLSGLLSPGKGSFLKLFLYFSTGVLAVLFIVRASLPFVLLWKQSCE